MLIIGFLIAYFFFRFSLLLVTLTQSILAIKKSNSSVMNFLKHKRQLNDVVSTINKALNNFNPELTEKRHRVEALTEQLVSQISDPARPGLGKRALELIREIEGVPGECLTEFGTRGIAPKELALH